MTALRINMPESQENPEIDSGGDRPTLDLTNERDRGMFRKAIQRWPKRWRGVSEADKDQYAADLRRASLEANAAADNPENDRADVAMTLASVVKTAAILVGQEQKDDHHQDTLKQDDKHLALDVAKTLAAVGNDQKIALIRRAGLGHLLPAEVNTAQETPDARNSPPR